MKQENNIIRSRLQLLASTLSALGSLLGQQVLMDVGKYTTLRDGDVTQKLVQLLVVTDCELKVTRNDTSLLVITGGITSQLENFSSEVLKHGSEVDGSTGTNTLSIVALAEQSVNTTNWEGETGLRGAGLSVLAAASLATRFSSSHFEKGVWGLSER